MIAYDTRRIYHSMNCQFFHVLFYIPSSFMPFCLYRQCSLYQVVTGKIYPLKQHFLPPATAWRFTKIKLWSDPIFTRKWKNIWKSTEVYMAFVFMGHTFWKENIEDRVKLLESKVFNCCLKITMAGLREIGVKMREWHFRELSSWISKRGRDMSRLPPNQESAPLVYIFALPAMNGPFPADLNFRENTVYAGILVS